jgi:hypothetical protein
MNWSSFLHNVDNTSREQGKNDTQQNKQQNGWSEQHEEENDEIQEEEIQEKEEEYNTDGYSSKEEDTIINTLEDALNWCKSSMMTQIEKANTTNTKPNTPIFGDSRVRLSSLVLLPDIFLRGLFIDIIKNRASWPRIRSLFGAPPYNFLSLEDAHLLRAGGIASTRKRMVYQKPKIPNYNQFGTGHFTDGQTRRYKVVTFVSSSISDPLLFDLQLKSTTDLIYMIVCIKKKTHKNSNAVVKHMGALFPKIGDLLTLTNTKLTMSFLKESGKKVTQIKINVIVKSFVHTSPKSSTAIISVLKRS